MSFCALRMVATSVFMLALAAPFAMAQNSAAGHALLNSYCIGCHNTKLNTAGVSLDKIDFADIAGNANVLEKVLRKVGSGQMPPPGMPHPDTASATTFSKWLESSLDAEATAHPNPGRTAIHRLNRAEYSNAVRDILALDVNPGAMLPVDDTGYGFDNIGDVLSVSPILLERYISVAKKISRMAVGDLTLKPAEEEFEPRRAGRGERVSDDLPFNSTGGLSISHYFPVDAEYIFRLKSGGGSPQELRIPVKAGQHIVGVTSPRESLKPEVILAGIGGGGGGGGRGGGGGGSLDLRMDGAQLKRFATGQFSSLSIAGPYNILGRGDTPARRKIFICEPANAQDEAPCARKILANLSRQAYRRPVSDSDIRPLVAFYQNARQKGDFDFAIQNAVEALLVAPDFLFRVEVDPAAPHKSPVHRITDIELASRLSFFIWSSVPDEELLGLASAGKLSTPVVLRAQVQRMLSDPKSDALVTNFAGQWLFLRNLQTIKPDPIVFAAFDDSLRAGLQKETELFFGSILHENRSVLDLLNANYTFLNERLATHYGIPNIYGSQFRRVTLDDPNRGGILGQGSLLTVTSLPNRTSVVQRGKWILENLLGAPPPPPPPDVPALEAVTKGAHNLSLREAMEQHRANPSCAGCHSRMDPLGFALENYDGIGRWRTSDAGTKIDASGKLPDGTQFDGPAGLKKIMTTVRKDEFVTTVAEKLLTYALGRGVEYYDRPVLRGIVRQSESNNYRLDDMIVAVVNSTPFQMRRSADQ